MLASSDKSVILICMMIKEDYQLNQELNITNALNSCMTEIASILIEPMMKMNKVSEVQKETLCLISQTLRVVALKAQAYEDLQSGNLPEDWQN